MWTLSPRGPDWMPITPKTGSLFHAETQQEQVVAVAAAEIEHDRRPGPAAAHEIAAQHPLQIELCFLM